MKTVVIGTAGHIDHGKSELVAALTGTHPDRLREERERGITIDIGFANLPLPDVVLSFIDVPGHERFVKNMLAGASGIDIVLLVVAADESIRPQTREHFHICRLLGLQRGVVALTKIDLVDAELVELATAEVRDFVEGSFLERAEVVPVSARTREGIPALVEALHVAAREAPERGLHDRVRLPVDRSFTVKGFGTVVTGTLLSGSIEVGADLEIPTSGRRVKVRGMEVHGQPAPLVRAGQRAALNLQGLSHHDIQRGNLLAEPGAYEPTSMFDAKVSVLDDAAAPIQDLARVRLHAGTAEILARVRPIGAEEILPGQHGYAQFRLERPAVLAPGDRFIFRRYSPATTLGGGVVIDPFPEKHRRRAPLVVTFLEGLEGTDLGRRAESILAASPSGAATPVQLARRLVEPWERVQEALANRLREGRLLALGAGHDLLILRERLESLKRKAIAMLEEFHARQPMLPGYPLEEFRGRLDPGLTAEAMRGILSELIRSGALRVEKDVVSLPDHRPSLTDQESRLAERLGDLYRNAGLNPPDTGAALAEVGGPPDLCSSILAHLVREGTLRRLRDGRIFHAEALADLRRRLKDFRTRSETIDIATFKDLAGVSRKHAIPLLEHLDEERVTLRRGSERVILD